MKAIGSLVAATLATSALLLSRAATAEDQTYSLANLIQNPGAFRGATAIHAELRQSDAGLEVKQADCDWHCPTHIYLGMPNVLRSVAGAAALEACVATAAGAGNDLDTYVKVRIVMGGESRKLTGLTLAGAIQGQIVSHADHSVVADCNI